MDRRSFLTGIVTLVGSVSEVGGYQSARAPKIGYLSVATERIPIDDAFDAALKTLGYIEGQNITLHRRYLGGCTDNAGSAANELVALNPDVIVVWSTLLPKYLEIARELVPRAFRFALLAGAGETAHRVPAAAERAAQMLKIELRHTLVATPEQLTTALEAIGSGDTQVLVAPPSALLYLYRRQVIEFTEKRRLPAVYGFREVTSDGV